MTRQRYALILYAVLLVGIALFDSALQWDENAYLGNARSHLGDSAYTEDFRFPLLEYLIASSWMLTGESVFAARLVSIIMTVLLVVVFYAISVKQFGKNAFLYTSLFALNPLLLQWGTKAYPDVGALFFVTLAFFLIMRQHHLLAGIAAGFGFLTKFPVALFGVAVGLVLIWRKEQKQLVKFCVGYALVIAPWMVYNYIVYGNPLWDFFEQFAIVAAYTPYQSVWIQLLNGFWSMGLLFILMPIGIIWLLRSRSRTEQIIGAYAVLVLGYFLFFVNIKLGRYYLAALSFLVLAGLMVVHAYWSRWMSRLLLASTAIVTIMFFFSLHTHVACMQGSGLPQIIEFVQENTNASDVVLSNFWPWLGYGANITVYTFWDQNITRLAESTGATYIATSSLIGDPVDLRSLNLPKEFEYNGSCNHQFAVYSAQTSGGVS